ncbi:uncharacterized protein LOC128201097 [Galleria mellonella]|uniref:Uncharacterized protein LOC128201097 n=1 Tax=Galleria mellonella TaxID=7137 RepID=A0ABM3MN22_GALME|nr:uncharacterized protein LOC128201097 [Galleria mellonella]
MQWHKKGTTPPKKLKVSESAEKIMATIFWDTEGILLIDYKDRGVTGQIERSYQGKKKRKAVKRCAPFARQCSRPHVPSCDGCHSPIRITSVIKPPTVPSTMPVRQRLGPPVNKLRRIAPVSGALAAARRDPRLARLRTAAASAPTGPAAAPVVAPVMPLIPVVPQVPIAPNVFDIKSLEHVAKRKNGITIDVRPDEAPQRPRDPRRRDPRRRDPRLENRDDHPRKDKTDATENTISDYIEKLPDPKKINNLPPIPKINRGEEADRDSPVPNKKRKGLCAERKQKREEADGKSGSSESSPEKKSRSKELKNYHRERHMRTNKEKSESVGKKRRRTLSSEDIDLRTDNTDDSDTEDHKKTISGNNMRQAKEQSSNGQLDKSPYNALMRQLLQLNEKLELKEAKQLESLEVSERKLKSHTIDENTHTIDEDIDESTPVFIDTPSDSSNSENDKEYNIIMRTNTNSMDGCDGPPPTDVQPMPPAMPMFPPFTPMWRGQPRPRVKVYGPRRFRDPAQQFFRGKFDKRAMRPPFDPRLPLPLPTPTPGMCQGESPLQPYERTVSPPPLGAPGIAIPPTDFRILEYIDRDPVKTIQIDGVPKEIRFYGETAVIMMDWDDPREIKFLPGCRRVRFDNKDSVVLSFNEGYKQVEIDGQVFNIRFGAPTRELYINGRWYECIFGGQPIGTIIDGRPRLVQLEGPPPQVDIGKTKRTDLVAGKINVIVNATQRCPVYLDAKVQKFFINRHVLTIRFVDSLRTVLINEQPFKLEFDGLPKPISIGNEKFFIRFSALPSHIKAGHIEIANMEGTRMEPVMQPTLGFNSDSNTQGVAMLASATPSTMAPASASEYSSAEPMFPILANINVNDLFAKLVASGIVQVNNELKTEPKEEVKEEAKPKAKEDKNVIHKVDLLRSETLKVKQEALVARLYGGMQCSGCDVRFPPEHTVRYSQHLDWHFRQNRRDRDSVRRAHSRPWYYDHSDWLHYEEIEDLENREKNWFETVGAAGKGMAEAAAEAPSVAAGALINQHCAVCGDRFQQFYNEDKEEWHLRNSLRHDDDFYHPQCFDDYKASLTKEKPLRESSIEIEDVDDVMSQSDNESVVEVVKTDDRNTQPVETVAMPQPMEDDGDEDDVVFEAQSVEQVDVEDDADTDDETVEQRRQRDVLAAIDMANVRVKIEPIDPDDEPIITAEETIPTAVDTTHVTVLSSIDGNVQLEAIPAPVTSRSIRINISKSIPSFVSNVQENKMLEEINMDDEPLPPGEEPQLSYKLKPTLENVQFSRQPPANKGNELSGLCSIM